MSLNVNTKSQIVFSRHFPGDGLLALKNREAATRNKRGGLRRGAGRPLGRTDGNVPRKGTASEKDRFQALQANLGKLYKEIERLRNELQYGNKFKWRCKRAIYCADARVNIVQHR